MAFKGFPKETLTFFRDLEKNNSKTWFDEHRKEYDRHVMEPARSFVEDMGGRLKEIAPGIVAEPKVNRSIFRIYRDTRFSKDKTPYKTNLGLWFWEGSRGRKECSGFYLHVEAKKLMLGVGMHMFTKPLMEAYRESVVHPIQGPALVEAIKAVEKGGYSIHGKHYKRVPRGYDKDHKNAQYLLYNGMAAMEEGEIPAEFHGEELLEHCFTRYRAMAPLHRWLLDLSGRAKGEGGRVKGGMGCGAR